MFPKKVASFRKFETIGSVGKKPVSGDIDLAYDIENLMPGGKPDLVGWGIDPYEFKQSVEKIQKAERNRVIYNYIKELIENLKKQAQYAKKPGGNRTKTRRCQKNKRNRKTHRNRRHL